MVAQETTLIYILYFCRSELGADSTGFSAVELLYSFPKAAITKYRNLGGLKQQKFFLFYFWRLEVQMQCAGRAMLPLRAPVEDFLCLFLPWWPQAVLGLWQLHFSLHLNLHMAVFCVCLCVSVSSHGILPVYQCLHLIFSHIRTSVNLDGAPPNNFILTLLNL